MYLAIFELLKKFGVSLGSHYFFGVLKKVYLPVGVTGLSALLNISHLSCKRRNFPPELLLPVCPLALLFADPGRHCSSPLVSNCNHNEYQNINIIAKILLVHLMSTNLQIV